MAHFDLLLAVHVQIFLGLVNFINKLNSFLLLIVLHPSSNFISSENGFLNQLLYDNIIHGAKHQIKLFIILRALQCIAYSLVGLLLFRAI